jgi:hypothetical protein
MYRQDQMKRDGRPEQQPNVRADEAGNHKEDRRQAAKRN